MDITVAILICMEALLAYWLLYRSGILRSTLSVVLSALLLGAAFGLRVWCLDYETLDYQNFLTVWVDFFRQNGGFSALRYPIGNYNIPYLYFLALNTKNTQKDQ